MPMAAWGAAAVAVLTGIAVAAWSLVGLLGLDSWVAVLAAMVAGTVLLALVVLAAPDVLGTLAGLRDAARPLPPDPELLARLSGLSIHDVRHCAEEFERRGAALKATRSAKDRRLASTYSACGSLWRRLERPMHDAGAFRVGDLPDDDTERWARRMHLWRDRLSWDPLIPSRRPRR